MEQFLCINFTSRPRFHGAEAEQLICMVQYSQRKALLYIHLRRDSYSIVRMHPLMIKKLPAWTKIPLPIPFRHNEDFESFWRVVTILTKVLNGIDLFPVLIFSGLLGTPNIQVTNLDKGFLNFLVARISLNFLSSHILCYFILHLPVPLSELQLGPGPPVWVEEWSEMLIICRNISYRSHFLFHWCKQYLPLLMYLINVKQNGAFPRKDIIIINQFFLIYIFTKTSLLDDPLAAEYYS